MYPDKLKYTKDHEWIEVKGETATIGVSFFAQKELGDVVFVELPEIGRRLKQGEEFGTIESVKAVSEVYSPASGEVIDVNAALKDHPEQINQEPYGNGWILRMKLSDSAELSGLMDATAYTAYVGQGGH
ncbi:MAG TPA: glycine cleavage system protein GcvH [Candidatus Polarisedimenticolia bacterium]|nr:glycine cleavage system protein GcvH [Candidatus Polarisedimenticolia bacterium]